MGASADRQRLSFVEETVWGVTPATPTLQKLNNTSEDIDFTIKTRVSDSKRADRMTADVILTSAGAKGGFDFEMQAVSSGPTDPLLLGALFCEKWTGLNTTDNASISATGATIVASTKTFDVTGIASLDATKFFVGKTFYLNTTTANKGFFTIASITSPGVFVVYETVAIDETCASGVTIIGETAKNGLYKHSYTFEKFFEDVTEGFIYKGMTVDTMSIKFQSEKAVTGSFSFVGKDVELSETLIGTGYTEPPLTPFMSANFNVSQVKIDGIAVESCLIESVDMQIKNNVDGKSAIGTFGYCRTREGAFEVTGKMSMFFNDSTMYEKYIENESFSLSFVLSDNVGYTYIFKMPRIKLSEDQVFAKGKNSDVMDDAKYVALADNTTGCMLQIDRFYIPV